MKNATVELTDNDLRLLLDACRTLASRYARDADYERNPVMRRVLVDAAAELGALGARLQNTADRVKASRFEPDPEPPPQNVTPLRR